MAALGFIVLLILVAIVAPLISRSSGARPPDEQSTTDVDKFGSPTGPSTEHLFGVDPLGRDVFSRVLYGARVSLEVAFISTGRRRRHRHDRRDDRRLSVAAGSTRCSRADRRAARVPDPPARLGLASACALGRGCLGGDHQARPDTVIFIITIATWTYIARIIRGQVLSLREKEFVEAARSLGASDRRIIFREILPNLVAPIIVYTTLIIPTNILFEAALSFLGVGVQPPTPSWGR